MHDTSRRWLERLRRRPTLTAALLYALLSLLIFAPAMVPGRTLSASDYLWTATPWEGVRPASVPLLGSNREQTDAVLMFQPQLEVTRARLPDVPLWNPHIMGGRPYLANSQSAVFSPFSVPAYVLPLWDALPIIAALKLFVAALGTFMLGRAVGMRFAAALLAGVVFGFSLWCVTWVAWTTLSVWALLPWMCLLSELLVRRPGPLPFAGLATAVGLQFLGGHPSSSFQILVPLTLFWVVRVLLARPLRLRQATLRLGWFGASLATGTALAAVMLIPFAELLQASIDLDERVAGHRPARYLLALFLPGYWGHTTRGTSLEFAASLEEQAYYVGALPLMLAVAALVLRPDRARFATAGVGVAALAVATGIPPLYGLVVRLPGFADANNWRLAVITVLCLALLAAWGLQDLMGAAAREPRRRAVVAAGLGLFAAPFVFVIVLGARAVELEPLGDAVRAAWMFASPPPEVLSERSMLQSFVRLAALLQWLVVAACAVALLALRLRGRLGAPAFAGLGLVLVAADLVWAGMGYNPAIPRSHAEQPATAAIRYLQSQRPQRFAGLDPLAPISLAPPLTPNAATRYGLYDARGYDFPVEKRYVTLWRRAAVPTPDHCNYAFCPGSVSPRPTALRMLGLLGVKHLLQSTRDAPLRGFRLAYTGPDARVYENPHALPRAFLVDRQLVAPTDEAGEAALTSPGFAARTTVVTNRPIAGLAHGAAPRTTDPGEARIVAYEPERVVVRASAAGRSMLVLTDSWFTGWKATVDGRPAPVHRVDHILRGVLVPAGEHLVEFRYAPASWRAGWIISVAALLVILLATALGMRARRARGN